MKTTLVHQIPRLLFFITCTDKKKRKYTYIVLCVIIGMRVMRVTGRQEQFKFTRKL